MNAKQKAAFLRLLIDIIKADMVIDSREIEDYLKQKKKFSIKKIHEQEAYEMSLGEALGILKTLGDSEKAEILTAFNDMKDSDNNAPREEALLMLMIYFTLENTALRSDVISKEVEDAWFDERQVLFVESSHDKDINFAISTNYRDIENELKLCGFDFVYLPHIISHYVTTPQNLLNDVISMLSPNLSDAAVNALQRKIKLMKTDTFCKEQLANKLDFDELRETYPALIFRIGQSRVGNKILTNFLRVEVTSEIKEIIKSISDLYHSFTNSDSELISYKKEEKGRFLYKGFYRQLFDILLLQKSVVTNLLIDFTQTRGGMLSFDKIDLNLRKLHRRDKALYLLFIFVKCLDMENNFDSTKAGRISFSIIKMSDQDRIKKLQAVYGKIYEKFEGNKETVPDISDDTIRRPILSNIKKVIMENKNKIYHCEDYIIRRNVEDSTYCIKAELSDFFIKTRNNLDKQNFCESHLYKELKNIYERS